MEWFKQINKTPSSKKSGQILLLNGTSSSGKTTIAKILQEKLYEDARGVYLYWSVDDFLYKAPQLVTGVKESLVKEFPQLIYSFHATIPATVSKGINLIVDHVFQEKKWVHDFMQHTKNLDTVLVGVECPLEIAKQREKSRGDRDIGMAEYQFERVHRNLTYDFVVDTSETDAETCASLILDFLKKRKKK